MNFSALIVCLDEMILYYIYGILRSESLWPIMKGKPDDRQCIIVPPVDLALQHIQDVHVEYDRRD